MTKRYSHQVEQHKADNSKNRPKGGALLGPKIKKKIIAAIKSLDQNESLDFWLTLYKRPLSALKNGTKLEVHFSSKISSILIYTFIEIIPNKSKQVCSNDFQLLKVIGRGGFSKVFLVRKKDSGLLFAMKVMQKSFIMTDGKLK